MNKNLFRFIIFLMVGYLVKPLDVFSQSDLVSDSVLYTSYPDSVHVDSTIIDRIPPLKNLIDSAVMHSFLVHRQAKQIEIKELRSSAVTQEWLKYINVFATSNYGVYDNFMSVQDQSVIGSTINTGNSFRWSVGITLSGSPLYDFFNKPTLKKIQNLEAEQERESWEDIKLQIKKLVIEQYNQTLMSYKILIISIQNVYSNYTQLILSEQEFYQGNMEIFAMANVREMYYKSLMTYEKSKYEFEMNYMILEVICGFQF